MYVQYVFSPLAHTLSVSVSHLLEKIGCLVLGVWCLSVGHIGWLAERTREKAKTLVKDGQEGRQMGRDR